MKNSFMTYRLKIIKNQHGMGLVGVMVIAGIGMIIMGGMTSMITDVFKAQKAMQSKDANREIVQAIRGYLSDPAACANSFGLASGLGAITSPNVVQATQIKDKNNNIIYQTNTSYLNNLVKVTNFELKNYDSLKKIVDLDIKIDKVGSTIGGTQMVTKTQLQVTVDGTTKITSCHALGSADSLWQLNSNLTDIYYNGGNVGVGTTSPISPLTVVGTIRSDLGGAGAVGTGYVSSNGVSNFAINHDSSAFAKLSNTSLMASAGFKFMNGTNTAPVVTIDNISGNIGIGPSSPTAKLDVNGEIKLSSTGLACNASTAGAMRYSGGSIQYCNGTAWAGVGGGGGTLVNMYQCPGPVSLGGGAWGYYGCQNQITNTPTCYEVEYPSSASFNCAYIGKMMLLP